MSNTTVNFIIENYSEILLTKVDLTTLKALIEI
jgi:hypothetical protein